MSASTAPKGSPTGARCEIRVTAERCPLALSRVLGLVATVYMVPDAVECLAQQDELRMRLSFAGEEPRRLDLLCRKIAQLTETLGVDVTHSVVDESAAERAAGFSAAREEQVNSEPSPAGFG